MKHILGALFMLMSIVHVFAQKNPTEEAQPIVQVDKQLFKSELASWIGTDLFLAKYQNRQNIGGYFSYIENDTATCVFFSKSAPGKIIGTIRFDGTYAPNSAVVSLEERDFITATDICTLMLYAEYTQWKTHNVVSENYLNIWYSVENRLVEVPLNTFEEIKKDLEKQEEEK